MENISTLSMLTSAPTSNSTSKYMHYLYKDLDLPQRVILAIIFLIISVTGIIGNTVVILAIVLSRKLRSTLNWFVLNLACADILTCICIPFHVLDLLGQKGWVQLNWFQLDWPYIGFFYVNTSCVGVNLTTHAFIGFTSWYLITRNQEKFKKLFQSRNIFLMVAFSWVFNFSSLCLIARLEENEVVYAIASWVFVHFAVVVTVYIKLWRFIAHRAKTVKKSKNISDKIQSGVDMNNISNDTNNVQETGNIDSGTVLGVSKPSEKLVIKECKTSNGKPSSGEPENLNTDTTPSAESPSQEPIDSGPDRNASETELHVYVNGSNQHFKKQTEPKVDKKVISVTKNLLVILVAFVICFIPYAFSLCLTKSYSALPWLLALLLFNSCINPIIYARRIRVFREVMVCIIRCRLGSIPMPIDFVRKMRSTG